MKKSVFAICDSETAYVYNLMEYIESRKGEEFEVQAFTSADSLITYASERKVEMLLISSSSVCDRVRDLGVGKIMVLSEGEQMQELSEYPTVYKYQPADTLVAEVMDCYARFKEKPEGALFKPKVRIIGVYSPVARTGKTSFALTLGQLMAASQAVLYLNLEGYAGFEGLMGRTFTADLSDLMYFSGHGKGNLICKLGGVVNTVNNLDYVPPAFSPFDLASVKCEDWLALIEELADYSSYDVIILDLGEMLDNLPEILRHCQSIYMPVREDSLAAAKLEQYEKILLARDYEDVLGKTRKLKIPFHSSFGRKENYVEQLIWGELGDYVRRLIREEEQR